MLKRLGRRRWWKELWWVLLWWPLIQAAGEEAALRLGEGLRQRLVCKVQWRLPWTGFEIQTAAGEVSWRLSESLKRYRACKI